MSKGANAAAAGEGNKDWSAFYLMKNEPDDFSVDDLAKEPNGTTCWGVSESLHCFIDSSVAMSGLQHPPFHRRLPCRQASNATHQGQGYTIAQAA